MDLTILTRSNGCWRRWKNPSWASRGRWVQLLGGAVEVEDIQPVAVLRTPLEERVAALEHDLERLKQQLEEKLGEKFE